jgi:hypothetical protein
VLREHEGFVHARVCAILEMHVLTHSFMHSFIVVLVSVVFCTHKIACVTGNFGMLCGMRYFST